MFPKQNSLSTLQGICLAVNYTRDFRTLRRRRRRRRRPAAVPGPVGRLTHYTYVCERRTRVSERPFFPLFIFYLVKFV